MEIKLQKNANDCGLICLQSFYHDFYKKWLPLSFLRKKSALQKKGLSVQNIVYLAQSINIRIDAYKPKAQEVLKQKLFKPVMILIKNNNKDLHYVILTKILRKKVVILDPVKGKCKLSKQKFQTIFQNVFLTLHQEKQNDRKIKVSHQIKLTFFKESNQKYIFFAAFITIINAILMICGTFYAKILFDTIIPSLKENELIVITLIFLAMTFFQVINDFVITAFQRHWYNNLISKFLNTFLYKSSHMPLLEIEKYTLNDKLSKLKSIEIIVQYWINWVQNLCSIFLVGFFGLITLFFIELQTAFFTFALLMIIFFTVFWQKNFIFKKQKKIQNKNVEVYEKLYEFLAIPLYIKIKKVDELLKNNVNHKHQELNRLQFQNASWNQKIGLIKNLLLTSFPFFLYFLLTKKYFSNQLEIGTIIVFVTIFHLLTKIIYQLSNFIFASSNYRNEIETFENYLFTENEELNLQGYSIPKINHFLLENFQFQYKGSDFSLKIKNLMIDQNICFVGSNGCGKSTLIKCLSSFYQSSGLKINSISSQLINLKDYRQKIILLNSQKFLPSINILDWITQNDDNQKMQLRINLEKFNLTKILEQYQINFLWKKQNNNTSLSSGQKQIIQFLRLFVKKYDVIFLDEPFNHIDNFILQKLIKALQKFQNQSIFIGVFHHFAWKKSFKMKEINFHDL